MAKEIRPQWEPKFRKQREALWFGWWISALGHLITTVLVVGFGAFTLARLTHVSVVTWERALALAIEWYNNDGLINAIVWLAERLADFLRAIPPIFYTLVTIYFLIAGFMKLAIDFMAVRGRLHSIFWNARDDETYKRAAEDEKVTHYWLWPRRLFSDIKQRAWSLSPRIVGIYTLACALIWLIAALTWGDWSMWNGGRAVLEPGA